jgi:hypothetical protein
LFSAAIASAMDEKIPLRQALHVRGGTRKMIIKTRALLSVAFLAAALLAIASIPSAAAGLQPGEYACAGLGGTNFQMHGARCSHN